MNPLPIRPFLTPRTLISTLSLRLGLSHHSNFSLFTHFNFCQHVIMTLTSSTFRPRSPSTSLDLRRSCRSKLCPQYRRHQSVRNPSSVFETDPTYDTHIILILVCHSEQRITLVWSTVFPSIWRNTQETIGVLDCQPYDSREVIDLTTWWRWLVSI